MIVLIDADTPCFAAAVVNEENDEKLACWQVGEIIESTLAATNATVAKLFVTGKGNFRYSIYPEYKGNRIGKPRPRHLQACKEFLVKTYGATMSEGCEADDLISIEQHANHAAGVESIIVSIDKDLDQVSGWHYHPGIKRNGTYIREPRRYLMSPGDSLRFFYYQLLVGDTADNIKGAPGIGPKKAESILDGCTTDRDYFDACVEYFSCEEELVQNARCLYLWQKEGEVWQPPMVGSTETRLHCGSAETRDEALAPEVQGAGGSEN